MKEQEKMTYTSPLTRAIKVQMQKCIAQSYQSRGRGLSDMDNNGVLDEDF